MDKISCMRAFVAVVEAHGFSSAARKSGIKKALLSKYVAQLEDQLGTRLLQRTTRHVSLTEVGRAYYVRCLPLLEELSELESSVQEIQSAPSGELKLSAPTSFSELHLMNIISEFSKKYPDIRMTMMLTDRLVDLVEEGVDLALRIGQLQDSSLVARHLANVPIIAYASPAYLQQYGEPKTPEGLARHQCIVDTNYRGGTRWHFSRDEKNTIVTVASKHYVNSAIAVKSLVLTNNGIALSPIFVVADDIKAGRLNIILKSYEIETFGLYVVYSHRRHLSAKTRLFVDALLAYFTTMKKWEDALME